MGVVGKSVETMKVLQVFLKGQVQIATSVKLRKLIVRQVLGDRWWSREIAG
jgi:hypothetical protein